MITVNVDIFAQDIFSCISHRALDVRKFDVSENYNHNRINRNKQHTVNVEMFTQIIFSHISRRAIDARKFDVSENYNHNRTNRI